MVFLLNQNILKTGRNSVNPMMLLIICQIHKVVDYSTAQARLHWTTGNISESYMVIFVYCLHMLYEYAYGFDNLLYLCNLSLVAWINN
jgi:hypothetical protein